MGSASSSMSFAGSKYNSSTQPWRPQALQLRALFDEARNLYDQGPYQYGPDRVASTDPSTLRGLAMLEDPNATADSINLRNAGAGELQKTLRGDYLDPASNPWLAQTYETGARQMRRGYYDSIRDLGSSLAASGRAGGNSHAALSNVQDESFATGLGDYAAQLYGGNYQAERGRMGQAVGMADSLARGMSDESYRRAEAVATAGRAREEIAQRFLDDLVNRFNYEQRAQAEKLGEFAGFLGNPIMTSNARSKSYSSSGSMSASYGGSGMGGAA